MSKIAENLYLGAVNIAHDPNFIKLAQIKFILICAKGLKQQFNKVQYHQLPISDNPTTIIIKYFVESLEFIHNSLQKGAVLVHCLGGKSRSATIIIAYIMLTQKLRFKDAFQYVKSKHPVAEPNEGFKRQLKAFEMILQVYPHPKVPDFVLLKAIMDKNDIIGQVEVQKIKDFQVQQLQ